MESGKSPQTRSERASLDQLARTPYIQVVTYPKVLLRDARSRIRQIEKLGVSEIVFEGHSKIGRLGILGLGTVGVVVKANRDGRVCALKIRRTDANRPSMDEEVRITTMANRVGVGPEIIASTRDMMLMKYLDTQELAEWLKELHGEGRRDEARTLVHSLLNQCRKLDIMGIDHGQLSNLRKHAVVAEEKVWIIDFESAGTDRRPRNVTSAAQYLLVGGVISPAMRRALGIRDTGRLLELLSEYKSALSDFTYSKILAHLKLTDD